MERLGSVLKERRLELNLTLEDMSTKTKLSVPQLQAIEEGNISFFKEDLSYLNYFVRYYANALNVNYDEIRDILDDAVTNYTDAINLSQIQKKEEISSSVREKTKQNPPRNSGMNRAKPSYRKIDIPTLGLLVLAIAIIAGMILVGVKWIIPMIGSTDPITPPPIVNPNPDKEEDKTPEEGNSQTPESPETPDQKYVVTKIDATTYEIKGWSPQEEFKFGVNIQNRSWMQFLENSKILAEPKSIIYENGATIDVSVIAEKDKVFIINFGYFSGNTITLNGQTIEADKSILNKDIVKITFRFTEGV